MKKASDETVQQPAFHREPPDRKSTRLNSSHLVKSYAVLCLKKNNASDTQPPVVQALYFTSHLWVDEFTLLSSGLEDRPADALSLVILRIARLVLEAGTHHDS